MIRDFNDITINVIDEWLVCLYACLAAETSTTWLSYRTDVASSQAFYTSSYDRLQYVWGIIARDVVTPLNSQVMYETDLHSVLATTCQQRATLTV